MRAWPNPLPPRPSTPSARGVSWGTVQQGGEQGGTVSRYAWLDAGLPESTPATTIDRQCGSGLQAIQFAAQGVLAGGYDLVVAGGVENMSRVPLGASITPDHVP